jgi:hypothetical protein
VAVRIRALQLLLALAAALPGTAAAQPGALGAAESEQVVRALAAWLNSEDLDAGRLAPLKKYGQAVVPSLIAALDAGPSSARRELARRSLETQYETLAKYSQSGGKFQLGSKADFVQHYMGNLETLYRIRAAQALAAIGGSEARTALHAAAGKAGREDLRKAIQRALEGIK